MPKGVPITITPAQVAAELQRVAAIVEKEPTDVTLRDMALYGEISGAKIHQAGGLTSVKNAFFKIFEPRDDPGIQDIRHATRENAKLRRLSGDMEALFRRAELAVEEMPAFKPTGWQAKKTNKKFSRAVQIILSDHHIGLNLDPREAKIKFGPVEESRSLAYVVKNVCEYKLDHRDETFLVVNILGDIIENHLHAGGAQEELHIQTKRAMWVYAHALEVLSKNYKKVVVYFSVGNHGRDTSVSQKRQTASKYNGLETTIYFGICMAVRNLKNVEVHLDRAPEVEYKIFGHKFYGAHGDTNFSVPGVGGKIDVQKIEAKVNRMNANLPSEERCSVYMLGHHHQATVIQLPDGTTVIVNGSLCPPNNFARTMGYTYSPQTQIMYEVTEANPVGDLRMIMAAGSDEDESLDEIIPPYQEKL